MKLLFALIFLSPGLFCQAQMDSLRTYYQWSIDAYKAAQYADYLKYTTRANEIRPNHPTLAYNLASALALNEMKMEAVKALKSYLMLNATIDYSSDTDFDLLSGFQPYHDLEPFADSLNQTVSNSSPAFEPDVSSDHLESITYDPNQDRFFLGSVRSRQILSYHQGKTITFLKDHPKLFAVMGLDVDESNNMLWVCSAAMPGMIDYHDSLRNKSSILGIDLQTGKVKVSYIIPNATLGDLIVHKDGSVLASDGLGNRLIRADGDGFEVLMDLSDKVMNLQGLALGQNELLVSDYITGLYRVNLVSQRFEKVNSQLLFSDKGTDGLLWYGNQLIAFQNGTKPNRVILIQLEENEPVSAITIDQNNITAGEPTQGVLVGDQLYFIANSAWHAYDDQGNFLPENALKPAIRVYELR